MDRSEIDPIKITFLLPALNLHGGTRVIAIYAQKLIERGHEVDVVVPGRRYFKRKIERIKRLSLRNTMLKECNPAHLEELGVPYRILDKSCRIKPGDVKAADVVIATWWETVEWLMDMPDECGVKLHLAQDHEVFPGQPLDRVRKTYSHPIGRIAVSRWLTETLRSEYGLKDVTWVPNSVDIERFNAEPRGKQPSPTMGMLYSKAPRKECSTALKAFTIAKEKVADLRLIAFGQTPPGDDPHWPSEGEFICRPDQELIPGIYASCDAWLFSSWSEGFGLPLLEALACRTPVIATPGGAAPDLIGDNVGILLGEASDPNSMAEAIVELATLDTDAWRRLSEASRRTVQRYTWEDAANLFEMRLLKATGQWSGPITV